jgi:hypothetical protein
MLVDALNDGKTGVILLDLVIGYGATENPAGELIAQLPAAARNCLLIRAIRGTEDDPHMTMDSEKIMAAKD